MHPRPGAEEAGNPEALRSLLSLAKPGKGQPNKTENFQTVALLQPNTTANPVTPTPTHAKKDLCHHSSPVPVQTKQGAEASNPHTHPPSLTAAPTTVATTTHSHAHDHHEHPPPQPYHNHHDHPSPPVTGCPSLFLPGGIRKG